MIIYWWIVLVYVLAVTGYGAATYIIVCPYFFDLRSGEFIPQGQEGLWLTWEISTMRARTWIEKDSTVLHIADWLGYFGRCHESVPYFLHRSNH